MLAEEPGRVVVGLAATADRASPRQALSPAGSLAAELVIVAAGLGDAVRSAAGADRSERRVAADSRVGLGTTLPADAGGPPPGELVMAVSRRGYCGVVRLEDGRIDIAAAVDRGIVAASGSPAAAIAAILAETGGDRAANLASPKAAAQFAAATARGAPPLTRSRPVASPSGRILRVGDAAGYVEPFTGEGMGWALASARLCDEALTPLVTTAGRLAGDVAAAGIRYALAHGRHFAPHHARCRRVALVVRRPWLVGPALRLARLAPAVAARVVPLVIGGAHPRKGHG
jgi:flavin-dependent dehydrogenase